VLFHLHAAAFDFYTVSHAYCYTLSLCERVSCPSLQSALRLNASHCDSLACLADVLLEWSQLQSPPEDAQQRCAGAACLGFACHVSRLTLHVTCDALALICLSQMRLHATSALWLPVAMQKWRTMLRARARAWGRVTAAPSCCRSAPATSMS